jgi:ABC-type uncharacterized transport system involved in gliding motility auxiliary subunit
MNALKSLDRNTLGVIGIVLAIVLFVALNLLSTITLRSAQLDLTEGKLFTLSEGTKEVLSKIEEPIKLRFYASRSLTDRSPIHGNYIARVREFLENYVDLADGKLILEIHDPEPYSAIEDEAVAYGLQGVPLTETGEQGYFGLAGTNSTDDEEKIPFFNLQREQNLEYDLTRLVYDLSQPKQKVLGLITSLNMASDPLNRRAPWAMTDRLKQFFDVRTIEANNPIIDDDIDVLMLAHPQGMSKRQVYAIDQFILKGGRAIVFLDPHSEYTVGLNQAMRRPDGGNLASGYEIKSLMDAWGVRMDMEKFVGDQTYSVKVNAASLGGNTAVDYLPWFQADERVISKDDVITAELKQIFFASSGSLVTTKDAKTKLTPLITSSSKSGLQDLKLISTRPNPIAVLEAFKPDDMQHVLAARVQGSVSTAFPKGPPELEGEKKEDREKIVKAQLKVSKEPVNLIVVADTDMLADRFWTQTQDFFGRSMVIPTSHNGDFVTNAVDNLTGSNALISLRSRGASARPFHVVAEIQKAAEFRYRKTEKSLRDKMSELETKLSELQKQTSGTGTIIVSDKQKSAMLDLRKQLLDIRRQLRDVQHALQRDIQTLDTKLKIINIWAVPLVISIIAIIMAIVRRRQRRQPAVA